MRTNASDPSLRLPDRGLNDPASSRPRNPELIHSDREAGLRVRRTAMSPCLAVPQWWNPWDMEYFRRWCDCHDWCLGTDLQ